MCLHVWGKGGRVDPSINGGKIENPVQSFDLLRSSDSIEAAAQVLTMDRVGSNAESEIIFMTRINLVLWAVRRYGGIHLHPPECSESANLLSRHTDCRNFFPSRRPRAHIQNQL